MRLLGLFDTQRRSRRNAGTALATIADNRADARTAYALWAALETEPGAYRRAEGSRA